ncbi:hypothetical protein AAVH_37308, partial [Aphelenchoides avenae]
PSHHHRQSPPKTPSPKKRRRLNDSPSSKRKRSIPLIEISLPNLTSPEADIDVVNCSRTNSFSVSVSATNGRNASTKADTLRSLIVLSEGSSADEDGSEATESTEASNSTSPPALKKDDPHRHHPDNLPKRNPEAALLEDFATVYMLNGFDDVNRQELQKTLENALRDLRTEDPSQSSGHMENERPGDSAYSSSASSRAASSSNDQEVECATSSASALDNAQYDADANGRETNTW